MKLFTKMRKFLTPVIILILITYSGPLAFAKVAPQKYFVQFTDKSGTPYTTDHPEAFLSARSILRRLNQGIHVITEDLPVTPDYVNQVTNKGVTVLTRSKWFNGITINVPDSTVIPSILALPFVLKIVKCEKKNQNGDYIANKFCIEDGSIVSINDLKLKSTGAKTSYNYGASYTQIHMVNGDVLHDLGYKGQGKQIALLDAGFYHANVLPAFDSLYQHGQILGTKDFVNPGNNVYNEYAHGMAVLSIMGGNIPGQLVGTAPKAGFWLLRTEDVGSENIIEEYNWDAAAEFADSVGVDIINSSLGYTQFDDPSMNHTWADLNGNSTPVTMAANIAANKGIAVCNSAGNYGASPWHYLICPADGFKVLAVAGVDSLRNHASFSSIGWIRASDYVKPNVAAMAYQTVLSNEDGTIIRSSGTSFSSPIVAGLVACLWQSAPGVSNFTLFNAIRESASLYIHPDSILGYGIPDFSKALALLSIPSAKSYTTEFYPNPFSDHFTLKYHSPFAQDVSLDLYDMIGNRVYLDHSVSCREGDNRIYVTGLSDLQKGCYILKFTTEISSDSHQMIKIN
jgi:serine protease AprX